MECPVQWKLAACQSYVQKVGFLEHAVPFFYCHHRKMNFLVRSLWTYLFFFPSTSPVADPQTVIISYTLIYLVFTVGDRDFNLCFNLNLSFN